VQVLTWLWPFKWYFEREAARHYARELESVIKKLDNELVAREIVHTNMQLVMTQMMTSTYDELYKARMEATKCKF
jgi:hypothetical protein